MAKFRKGQIPWNKNKKGFKSSGSFKKGHIPWTKGLTKETDARIKKVSDGLRGRIFTKEHRKKLSEAGRGKIFSEEHKRKLREKKVSEETKRKISESKRRYFETHFASNKGLSLSDITRNKISQKVKDWHKKMRGTIAYKEFNAKRSRALKGRISWSKGLTKETDERIRKLSESNKGKKSWNKGLTKEIDIRIKKMGEAVSKAQLGRVPWNKGKKRPPFSKDWLRKMAESHRGLKHSKETLQKMGKIQKKLFTEEKRELFRKLMLNGGAVKALRGVKNPSREQVRLYNFIKKIYPSAQLNFPIKVYNAKHYSLDVAIPELKIDFEYDGLVWHSEKGFGLGSEIKDFFRDERLIELGWAVVRIKGKQELKTLEGCLN